MEMKTPTKAWNEMKGKMEDTSLPEWQEYYQRLAKHEKHYEEIKPKESDFKNHNEYLGALNEWSMNESCSAPNKPGYYRANND